MITIKCFGRVEISGEGKLPLDIAIESTNEIGVMSLGVELTGETEAAAFMPLNGDLSVTGTSSFKNYPNTLTN